MITDHKIYRYFHKHCPQCDGIHIYQQLCGMRHDENGYLFDNNEADCGDCKWHGRVHELLPKDKDLGPLKEGHICKHNVRWPHECAFCEDYIYGLQIGKFPLL